MSIKRVHIDPAKLGISADPEGDRRRLFEQSRYSAQDKIDAVRSIAASHGHGAMQIRERLDQRGLILSMADLMGVPSQGPILDRRDVFQGMETGMLTEEFPTHHDNLIMEENYRAPASQQQARTTPSRNPSFPSSARNTPVNQPQQRQALREQIAGGVRAAPATSQPPWRVKAFLGETRNGAEVPIWKVINSKTGSAIDKMFRLEHVATKVAEYLNQTGDINDPRVLSVMNIYDKRAQLLKEARTLEKTAEGKPMKTDRLRAIRVAINQLDSRLNT